MGIKDKIKSALAKIVSQAKSAPEAKGSNLPTAQQTGAEKKPTVTITTTQPQKVGVVVTDTSSGASVKTTSSSGGGGGSSTTQEYRPSPINNTTGAGDNISQEQTVELVNKQGALANQIRNQNMQEQGEAQYANQLPYVKKSSSFGIGTAKQASAGQIVDYGYPVVSKAEAERNKGKSVTFYTPEEENLYDVITEASIRGQFPRITTPSFKSEPTGVYNFNQDQLAKGKASYTSYKKTLADAQIINDKISANIQADINSGTLTFKQGEAQYADANKALTDSINIRLSREFGEIGNRPQGSYAFQLSDSERRRARVGDVMLGTNKLVQDFSKFGIDVVLNLNPPKKAGDKVGAFGSSNFFYSRNEKPLGTAGNVAYFAPVVIGGFSVLKQARGNIQDFGFGTGLAETIRQGSPLRFNDAMPQITFKQGNYFVNGEKALMKGITFDIQAGGQSTQFYRGALFSKTTGEPLGVSIKSQQTTKLVGEDFVAVGKGKTQIDIEGYRFLGNDLVATRNTYSFNTLSVGKNLGYDPAMRLSGGKFNTYSQLTKVQQSFSFKGTSFKFLDVSEQSSIYKRFQGAGVTRQGTGNFANYDFTIAGKRIPYSKTTPYFDALSGKMVGFDVKPRGYRFYPNSATLRYSVTQSGAGDFNTGLGRGSKLGGGLSVSSTNSLPSGTKQVFSLKQFKGMDFVSAQASSAVADLGTQRLVSRVSFKAFFTPQKGRARSQTTILSQPTLQTKSFSKQVTTMQFPTTILEPPRQRNRPAQATTFAPAQAQAQASSFKIATLLRNASSSGRGSASSPFAGFLPNLTTFGGGFKLPTISFNFGGGSRNFGYGGRRKYTPSFDALVRGIRGKASKGWRSALGTRPIPKGFNFAFKGRL